MTEEQRLAYLEKAKNRKVVLTGGEVVRVLLDASIEELRGKLVYVYMTHLAGEELSVTYRGEHCSDILYRDEVELTGIRSQWFRDKDSAVFVGSDFFINADIKRILPSTDDYATTYEITVLSSTDCLDSSKPLDKAHIDGLTEKLHSSLVFFSEDEPDTTPYFRCKWCNTLHKGDSNTHNYFYCDSLCEKNFVEKKEVFRQLFNTLEEDPIPIEEKAVVLSAKGHTLTIVPEYIKNSTKNIEKIFLDKIGYKWDSDFTDVQKSDYFSKKTEIKKSLPASVICPKYTLEVNGVGSVKVILSFDLDDETNLHSNIIYRNFEDAVWFQYEDIEFTLYDFEKTGEIDKATLISTFKAFLEYIVDERRAYESKDGVESSVNPNWLKEAQKATEEHNVAEYTRLLMELEYVSEKAEPLHFQMMMEGALSFKSNIQQDQIFRGNK